MKKTIISMIICTMALFAFSGCEAETPAEVSTSSTAPSSVSSQSSTPDVPVSESTAPESDAATTPTTTPTDISVVALKGPTAMGMVKFMSDAENGDITSNNYTFSIETAIDVVTPMIVKGEVDIAAVPANVASVLYNNSNGGIDVLAINTLGVLYIVQSGDTIQSIDDLAGKTIYASGKGATPEYALNQILAANGLTDSVTIEWKAEQAEVVAALAAEENAIAMLPQPFVTTAQTTDESIRVALDLTEVWDNSEIEGTLVTGVVVANAAFADENPAAVSDFMANYAASVDFVNNNLEEAATLVGGYEIVPEAVALTALPECNIVFVEGAEMKDMLSGYLNVLFEQNPQAIGGALPDDAFYYGQ